METRMKRFALYAAGTACLSLAMAGCGRDQPAATSGSTPASAVTAPATGTTSLQADSSHPALTRADQDFVAKAAGDNGFQIAMARLALQKSQTSAVRELAQRITTDHTRMNNELARIATRHSTTHKSTPVPVKRSEQLQNDLGRLDGDAFDRAFAGAMVNDHHGAIVLFSKEADPGENDDLRAFARKELPALQTHLAMAQALNKQPLPDAGKQDKNR
jgi:putative membrane protein